jgi:hypothetical protein
MKRKLVFPTSTTTQSPWSDDELKALVSYVRMRGHTGRWPGTKSHEFWKNAADFVLQWNPNCSQRSETACRNKVQGLLRKKFQSPTAAESHYFPQKLVASEATAAGQEVLVTPVLHGEDVSELTPEQALRVLSSTLKSYCVATGQPYLVPADDFMQLSLSAMAHLKSCGRSVYGLVKCLGTMRSDGSDSLLPAKRMPLGLIEHCVDFFASPSSYAVPACPDDYMGWLVSMFSLFGTKFVKLFNGPMWRVESTSQDSVSQMTKEKLTVNVSFLKFSTFAYHTG